MKLSILYGSKTGRTREMAEEIKKGMESVSAVEARLFSLSDIDEEFLSQSRGVVFGTPTYYANTCWQMKKWFDTSRKYNLSGKLGAAFATADYTCGGADTAILTLVGHMMVKGMLVYSGGSALGKPYIHLGAVALKDRLDEAKPQFFIFGQRIAQQAKAIEVKA